jgi:hypothetical protein
MNGDMFGSGGASLMGPPSGPSPISGQPQEGLRASARAKLATAVKGLMDALGVLKGDINSEEGKAIIKALSILAPVTPEVQEGVGQSEIMAMLNRSQAVRPGNAPGMLGTPQPRPNVMAGPPMGGGGIGGGMMG